MWEAKKRMTKAKKVVDTHMDARKKLHNVREWERINVYFYREFEKEKEKGKCDRC